MDRVVGVEPTTSAHSIPVPSALDENISISTNAAKRFSVMNLKRFAKSLPNSAASAFLSSFFYSWLVRFFV
jgi:hypothetical protein